jgi:hypothetical protein
MAEITKKPHGDEHHKPEGDANAEVSFERRDVNVFQITAFGIGLLISCMVVVFAMWALFAFLAHREDSANVAMPGKMAAERQYVPPEPRLSGVVLEDGKISPHPVYPRVELKEMLEDEDAILNNYGWVDPANGTVRIPIDQAIDMVAKKGLPSKPSPAGTDHDGYRTIPSVASSGRTLEKISQ